MKKKCIICGKEFEPSKYSAKAQKYCSAECRIKANYELTKATQSGERKPVRKRKKETYSSKRPMTPALERFFTKFALLLKED